MNETWKKLICYNHPQFNGFYEVSSLGRVRNIVREYRNGNAIKQTKQRILQASENRKGYLVVCLCVNLYQKTIPIHSLVASTYLGKRGESMMVCHWDGNKKNNAPVNLRYGTVRENLADSRRLGEIRFGEGASRAKLTEEIVLRERKRYTSMPRLRRGQSPKDPELYSVSAAARKYGVSMPVMWYALNNKTWKHL